MMETVKNLGVNARCSRCGGRVLGRLSTLSEMEGKTTPDRLVCASCGHEIRGEEVDFFFDELEERNRVAGLAQRGSTSTRHLDMALLSVQNFREQLNAGTFVKPPLPSQKRVPPPPVQLPRPVKEVIPLQKEAKKKPITQEAVPIEKLVAPVQKPPVVKGKLAPPTEAQLRRGATTACRCLTCGNWTYRRQREIDEGRKIFCSVACRKPLKT